MRTKVSAVTIKQEVVGNWVGGELQPKVEEFISGSRSREREKWNGRLTGGLGQLP